MKMRCNCIDETLAHLFRKLGVYIGHYPGYFVIVPFLVACILATGIQRLHYEDDPEYLFSPSNGRSKVERNLIDTIFPMNYTHNFNIGRTTHKGRFGRIIVVSKDGGNILRSSHFEQIVLLDALIKNMTVEWDDLPWRYSDLCAKMEDRCWENQILDFKERIKDIEEKKFFLKYPIWINQDIFKAYFFPAHLGGVKTDENSLVESAKAVNLMYFLDTTIKRGDDRAAVWENAFLKLAATVNFTNIEVARFVSTTLETELEANTQSLVPFFSITIIIMLIFSVGTCMMADWVRSKPWLGLLACVSAGLGVAASFGLAFYCGIEMIGINLAAPFLMLGVGMDDAFVLLAAWRRTNPSLPVPERLGLTYSEAAVSITITSITNFISFMIGTITPFPSVRIFCIYTSAAVLFTYIYHVTFFGGCMAIFGHAEKRNLHGLVCVPVMPKSLAKDKGFFFRLLCTGGRNAADPNNSEDNEGHQMMRFFRDKIAYWLNQTPVKLLVIFVFLIYLAVGVWGCTMVKEGLDRRKLSRDDSYSVQFYDYEDRYFREYPYRVQVVINATLDYSDPDVQRQVEDMLGRFESSRFVAGKQLTESWLRAYLDFLNQEDSFLFLQALNITDKTDFIRGLKNIFFHFPLTEQFRNDVVFNEDGTEIIASRYVIQTTNILDANMEKEMLMDLRSIADSNPWSVTVFHQLFIFFDQFVLVREVSMQTITVAAVVMMVISLIFIPSPSCAIWVAFSIVSIEIGVIGYMTHWSVNLDSISMINLIMCIGFSVDFSAHISYAYISCDEPTPAARVRSALYSLGLPIFQGSVSTILGIVALAFAPSYVFVTFFKTVFLVMLFGATHGVLLLPVLLSITDICRSHENEEQIAQRKRFHSNINDNHPFYVSEKHFNGKAIMNSKGVPIYIPRPSFTDIGGGVQPVADFNGNRSHKGANLVGGRVVIIDADSGKGSKSSTSSETSVAEKDLGLGTSAEECSEGSWKGGILVKAGEKGPVDVIQHQNQIPGASSSSSPRNFTRNITAPTIEANLILDDNDNRIWTRRSPPQEGQMNPAYVADSADSNDLSPGHGRSKTFMVKKSRTSPEREEYEESIYHQVSPMNQHRSKSASKGSKAGGSSMPSPAHIPDPDYLMPTSNIVSSSSASNSPDYHANKSSPSSKLHRHGGHRGHGAHQYNRSPRRSGKPSYDELGLDFDQFEPVNPPAHYNERSVDRYDEEHMIVVGGGPVRSSRPGQPPSSSTAQPERRRNRHKSERR